MKTELEKCREKLLAKTKDLEEFIYIVSHDVKAPLRAITNLVDWIEDDLEGEVPNDVTVNMDLLKTRVSRLERMISSLTDISRIHRMELDHAEVDVKQMCLEIIKGRPDSNKIELEIKQMPVFKTYYQKLKRVFTELISNAANFQSNSHIQLQIKAEDQGEAYKFIVKDNGIGISEDAIEKVKKIFYTVHLKDEMDTTGAGLTIADKIIDFAGGELSIQSKINEGTAVSFTWPKEIVN
ncbi:MAG: HAMP domain-containing histidine kinase [Bacteroidetes bacterium]|nr:HAMP domain-containing histidine kinase [Bacteroidota bacterium]